MVRIEKFGYYNSFRMEQANAIRSEVFIDEQLVDPEIEFEYEEESNYYLLILEDKPVATARWRETPKGIKLERFAMLKEYRNKGWGGKLMEVLLDDVIPLQKSIYLHSQVVAVNYYKRAGFVEKGEHFLEAEIDHVMMEYKG